MSSNTMNLEIEELETMEEDQSEAAEPQTVEQLRAEIEATRNEMSQTIDAIQGKLDPQNIKEQIKEKAQEATIGRAQKLAHTAGEKIAPVKDEVEHTAEKVVEAIKPLTRAAKKRGKAMVDSARHNPVLAVGATVAFSTLCFAGKLALKRLRL